MCIEPADTSLLVCWFLRRLLQIVLPSVLQMRVLVPYTLRWIAVYRGVTGGYEGIFKAGFSRFPICMGLGWAGLGFWVPRPRGLGPADVVLAMQELRQLSHDCQRRIFGSHVSCSDTERDPGM